MLGQHFYHGTIRKVIAVFGALFNDIKIGRINEDGNMVNERVVPLAYGPRQKFLSRLDERPTLPAENVAIKLPRMSFQAESITYDSTRQGPKLHTSVLVSETAQGNVGSRLYNSVPYKIGFDLSIMTKNQDEGLQIIEQIMPYFAPSLGLRIKPITGRDDFIDDMLITLNSVTVDDQYTGDFTTRRALVYSLKFDVIFNVYGGISDASVIKKAIITFRTDDATRPDFDPVIYAEVTAEVDPQSADRNDAHEIVITLDENFEDF